METGPPGRGLEGWREPEVGLRKRKAETVPARQMKRLAQLNVLLTELITDGCVHGECERGSGERPWSPRSLDSGERERGTPEVESPGEGDLGKGGRVGSEGGKVGPGVESGMGDCEIDVKPFVKDGRVDERVNSSGHSQKEGSAEPKFDLAADLLRGRMERQKERDTFDLLDEFLVDWTE